MKLNQLSILCALACAGFVGQASAQVAGSAAEAIINDANSNGRVLYISGASAVQGGLGQIAGSLFTGTNYFFTPSGTSGRSNSDYRAYAGKLATSAGGWAAGTNVIIINRARGGSVQGVNPVARGTSIESLAVTTASCTTGTGAGNDPFRCNTLDSRVPDAGVSDVAPRLFDGSYNTEGEPAEAALNATELASLAATPIYGLAFGVPITKNLPSVSLNKTAVSAIMTGNVGTWNQVNATLPADDILLCRRVNGSGTQAVNNLYFGNYPCSASFNVPADRNAGAAWNGVNEFIVEGNTGALNVVENSSSGNVRTCLDTAATAAAAAFNAAANPTTGVGYTSYTTADRAGNPVTVRMRNGRPHKAIGVLSMDSLNASTTTSAWTFRSLDGAGEITWNGAIGTAPVTTGTGKFPTLASFVDGTWDQQGWISFNLPSTTTGNKAALAADFVTQARSPAILQGLASLRWVAAGIPGVTDNSPLGGQVLRAGYLNGDQCGPLNRDF
ncbi:MAG: hypothetical protein DCF26_18555 [Burkholderiales bacterium]|nr:MAG: hypothetical protein DCF26_18555 [Burkholderiales bacterium]